MSEHPQPAGAESELPPPLELAARFRQLQGGDINGALCQLHEETLLLDLHIKPLQRGMKMAGLAVTWGAVLACHDPVPEDAPTYKTRYEIYDHIYPGSVLIYQPGGEMSSGHLGSLFGNMVAVRGAAGAVVDGNLRDSDGHLRIPNWCPFARNSSPLEAGYRIKWLEINVPVLMSGELCRWIEVHPGDMVFGDGDGVIIVPRRLILPVLELAEQTNRREEEAEREYAAGKDPRDVMEKYGVA